jgi:hypothetical protein
MSEHPPFYVGDRVQLSQDIHRSRGVLKAGTEGTVVCGDLPGDTLSVQTSRGVFLLSPRWLAKLPWRRPP